MRRIALFWLFFVSGAIALGYQVLWSKYLLEFIGVSAYSYATVLAAFMGGLAIGSWAFGRLADRRGSPLKLYGYLELGIGLAGVAYLPLHRLVEHVYAGWLQGLDDPSSGPLQLGAKIVASSLLLLVPTILMGGTYPALVRHATERLALVGRRASQLYAVNALGAVAGSLAMAFIAMPLLGMKASLHLLAALNALVALSAFALDRGSRALAPEEVTAEDSQAERRAAPELLPGAVRFAKVAVLVAGFLAFSYEVVFIRFFSLVLGSSTYSFAIIVAAFIAGIAIGSALLARHDRRIVNPLETFGWTHVAVGVVMLLALPVLPYLPFAVKYLSALLSDHPVAFYIHEFGRLSLSFLVMLPVALFLGMSLPLVVKGLSRARESLGEDSGRVYAWDTWGNVLGAVVAGLVLLPLLGFERMFRALAVASGVLGLVAVVVFATGRRRLAPAAVLAGLVALALGLDAWDPRLFTLCPHRRSMRVDSIASLKGNLATRDVLLFEDDPAGHLMVAKVENPTGTDTVLFVNGKPDASALGDFETQAMIAHLPLVFHRDPHDVLIVGLASGVSAGCALRHPIDRLDVVELLRAMPRATRLFAEVNGGALDDPRLHLILDDARFHLSYTDRRYDVVISEPSNPWMSGTGGLFTGELYRQAKRALKPGGIYMQWLQAYEIGNETLATIIRTFSASFPYVYAFQGHWSDLLLIGTDQPLAPDWGTVAARLSSPPIREQAERLGVADPLALLFLQRLSPASIDVIAASAAEENTDDNLLLEYRAPRELFVGARPDFLETADERLEMARSLLLFDYLRQGGPEARADIVERLARIRVTLPATLETALAVASAHAGLPLGVRADRVPGRVAAADEVAARIDRLLAERDGARAFETLRGYHAAAALEALASPPAAEFWCESSRRWAALAAGLEEAEEFRRVWIELLAAAGRLDEAAYQLDAWVASPQPPQPTWAIARACRLDRGGFCTAIAQRFAARDPAGLGRALLDAPARNRSVAGRLQAL